MGSLGPYMADDLIPNWDNYPNLDGLIKPEDIETKGGGKFAADYVPWMKIQSLLHEHARGWQFALRTTINPVDQSETALYKAGDGTGYILGYFRAPKGSGFDDTPELTYPVMDNRNNPIQITEISARDLSDADRRCRAAAAAAFFRLGWQLWTKDPIENPYREEATSEPAPKGVKPKAKRDTPTQAKSTAKPAVDPLEERRTKCQSDLMAFFTAGDKDVVGVWRKHMKHRFNGGLKVEEQHLKVEHLTTTEMVDECEAWIATYQSKAKA